MRNNLDLADLLKGIINKAVEAVGASIGIVKEIDEEEGLCRITPDNGSPEITAYLHKGQRLKIDSKVAYISSHLDSIEEDNYSLVHIFDYDEHLVRGNEKVVISVEANKITVIKDKVHIATEKDNSPAVLGDKLAKLLEKFKNDIVNHSHPYPGTVPLPPTVTDTNTIDTEEIKSAKVFLE